MVFHMKTTLVIDDRIMKRLKQRAAAQETTISALVESALRLYLRQAAQPTELAELPSFDGGGARVDVADRDSLYAIMEGR
jgi:predicted transcriptional regulator